MSCACRCRVISYTIFILRLTCEELLAGITCSHHGLGPNPHTAFVVSCYRRRRCCDVLMNTSFPEKVLQLVASVAETDEVRTNLELPLYECQLLDSIKTVELMIGIEEEFGLKISPAEFERENWETPRKIIADLESRMRVNV